MLSVGPLTFTVLESFSTGKFAYGSRRGERAGPDLQGNSPPVTLANFAEVWAKPAVRFSEHMTDRFAEGGPGSLFWRAVLQSPPVL